ncbi:MAG: UdgX family uracil-DNA binding protein [Verrucomicrobiota bacterium JB023]|nr:UdgX family uracil-DNA binding protein [Verrucomicrobiota bacterium JB023]
MHSVSIQPTLDSWRDATRELLLQRMPPHEVLFDDGTQSGSLFQAASEPNALRFAGPALGHYDNDDVPDLTISKSFLALAQTVACHRDPDRWSLLYHAAYRITIAKERHFLSLHSDDLLIRLQRLDKAVRRDRHKMKAFVRFRKVGENEQREQFVAWFEPEHAIVELTAPFFAKRFASFDWSILTPDRCAHWDGETLSFSPGIDASKAPQEDELEDYWRTYYGSIFNPARLKVKAMQAEMPKKYWKNLPEAPLIQELISEASHRSREMVEKGPNRERSHVSAKVPQGARHEDTDAEHFTPLTALRDTTLTHAAVREAAARCRACPLYESATQTVFGVGPEDADIMIVGEQPGDHEDLAGQSFVGPAGKLLDESLQEAGLERNEIYLTNTVKHFKWKPGPKGRRLHDRASNEEIATCKPWLLAEIMRVQPHTLILLGNTPARALVDPDLKILSARGLLQQVPPELAKRVIATVHPSYLLRLPKAEQAASIQSFVNDLRLAHSA